MAEISWLVVIRDSDASILSTISKKSNLNSIDHVFYVNFGNSTQTSNNVVYMR